MALEVCTGPWRHRLLKALVDRSGAWNLMGAGGLGRDHSPKAALEVWSPRGGRAQHYLILGVA